MTYKEFWEDDIYLAVTYRECHEIIAARENQKLWLAGLYTFDAVRAAVHGHFWSGKGRKPQPYMDKPIPMTPREIAEDKERKKQKTLEWVKKGQQ